MSVRNHKALFAVPPLPATPLPPRPSPQLTVADIDAAVRSALAGAIEQAARTQFGPMECYHDGSVDAFAGMLAFITGETPTIETCHDQAAGVR